ncbi:hypothetical protein, partial [Chroococcidiopsis sp.]|uniref:hypothetical protein n=1 Tax=Chroococcidiopsis sp. TaxID=3088168 RepID=UPI003F3F87F6
KSDWFIFLMQTPSADLFRAILRASKSTVNSAFFEKGVTLDWDLDKGELKGTFSIPIQGTVNNETGKFEITAKEFLEEPNP